MNAEAQRLAIATACGWQRFDGTNADCPKGFLHVEDLPDYVNDLNACHEMEAEASYNVGLYCERLLEITSRGNPRNATYYNLLHASAAHRAEALLKTLGLWHATPEALPEALPEA